MSGVLNAWFKNQRLFGLSLNKARSETDFRFGLCLLSKKAYKGANKVEYFRKRVIFGVRINL